MKSMFFSSKFVFENRGLHSNRSIAGENLHHCLHQNSGLRFAGSGVHLDLAGMGFDLFCNGTIFQTYVWGVDKNRFALFGNIRPGH